MAQDASPRMRCRRCGMHRLDDASVCAACEADLTQPGALEAAGRSTSRLAGRSGSPPQARRADDLAARRAALAERRTVPAARGMEPRRPGRFTRGQEGSGEGPALTGDAAVSRPAPAPADATAPARPAPVQQVSRFWWALDDKSRRTVFRLVVELVLLAVVVTAVWANTLGRSRPAASGSPSPTPAAAQATAPALGIAAADITTVFELPYAGGFAFEPVGTGADTRLEATSADGVASLALYGPRADLTRAVLTIHVTADHEVDVVGRQLMSVFLILYCPGALDQLQATLGEAISSGRDLAVGAAWSGIEARLETHLQLGGSVTVTLLPVATATPPPSASPPPSAAPTAAPGRSASPATSQPRSPAPTPVATPRVTPKPS